MYGHQSYPVQPYTAPGPQYQPLAVRQPTQWQTPAPQPIPATARGVAQERPVPKFVLPRPEALGVSARLKVEAPTPSAMDWNQVQARMERLGVVTYQKVRLQTGAVHVAMTLPGAAQPVEAQGATEAVAILAALQQAEARTR